MTRGGGKWKISEGGGAQSRWRPDGRELFYIANDRSLMAVDVNTAASFQRGTPKRLFDAGFLPDAPNVFRWDVAPDGKRFLISVLAEDQAREPFVILNWPELLKP